MSNERERQEQLQSQLDELLREVRALRENIRSEATRKRFPHPFEGEVAHDRRQPAAEPTTPEDPAADPEPPEWSR